MNDDRFKKLESEIEAERNLSKSDFAFSGFGRSTNLGDSVAKIDKLGQERIKALQQVIALEEALKKDPENESLGEALAGAIAYESKLASEAVKRRTDLSQKLISTGNKAGATLRAKMRIGASRFKPRRVKEFSVRKPKQTFTTSNNKLSFKRNKTFTENKVGRGAGIIPQRPISAITASNRSKSFGAKTTIAGKKA